MTALPDAGFFVRSRDSRCERIDMRRLIGKMHVPLDGSDFEVIDARISFGHETLQMLDDLLELADLGIPVDGEALGVLQGGLGMVEAPR